MRDYTQHRPDKASAFTLAALYSKNALATARRPTLQILGLIYYAYGTYVGMI
jgi:hypothetical protein